ncbi:putative recombination protein RecB [Cecembia lonarensis]|uniref:Putative recombination protein RecB n=1 Tax=Cecembia lonarensis (strain CCUG 58316 / KCTC 22772 / LW9) TaxID=1225176 RepID=K1L7E0_CECL9|nr:putative recombination protein RecB [Cecembia lonarensis]EKB48052.1 putative recombination protein RecB [Cecembia lonarensis LW9]
MEQVQEQLEGLFADSVFASWFEGQGQLLSEQGILLPGGQEKRPDRVILSENEAVVVDFKTGEVYERDKKQVKEYMDLVGRLSGKAVRGYLCYLETGRIEEVDWSGE